METTVVVKLLGRNIGYGVLHNRISSLWKPSQPFRLMDIENGYYPVRFQSRIDYDLALTQGPWVVFGHYLTVQPWTIEFDPLKPFLSVVTAWIRFPGLPGFLYKKRILEEIGSLVRKVMKLDFKIDSGGRGQFARMAVSIDLKKPLTSQVSINGRIQRVKFESLPTVCFHCSKYGHLKNSCSSFLAERNMQREKDDAPVTVDNDADLTMAAEAFGLWMVGKPNHHAKAAEGNPDGSRFTALFTEDNQMADLRAKKSGVDNSGVEILGLKEENKPGGSYGHRAEGNKGKEIVGLNSFIGLKDKAGGLVHLEVEQGKYGQGNSDHKIIVTESNNKPSDSSILSAPLKGHGLENIKRSGRSGRDLNKTIYGRGGCFKITGNSRVTLTDCMNSMAKLIGEQVETLTDTGCASSKFIRVFHEYNREHKPDLISLIETRVSERKADSIIAKLGFYYSHRVEAVDFSGVRISGTSFRQPLLVTFVYTSPNYSKRRPFWKTLQRTIPVDGSPWMAIGDFKAILSPSEKRGGRTHGKRCPFFGELMDSALLQDLGFRERGIMERLDRAICNNARCTLFPNSLVTHLPRLKSDHRPLKLSLKPVLHSSQGRPFRFLASWVEHSTFSDFVKKNWKDSANMSTRVLTNKLHNIEIEHSKRNSAFLSQVEIEVREDLENVLYHEEILWRQKARCDWLTLGDRNTKFFHTRTLRRRKQNQITVLKNDLGEWIMDEEQLNTEAVNFFKALYGEQPGLIRGLPLNAFSTLSDEDFNLLNRPVSNEEIKTALFDMAPLKAPGSDGFHAFFYQSQWDHIGASIIANHFKVVFPKLIAPEQTGFLAGRNITDNIVIAQEVLWNGVPTLKFQPTRGVRQGCPLSPYLFILCMEWLSHSIQATIGVGNWSPIRLVRNGPLLSHFFFVDDLILFGHAEEHQAWIIKNILDDFCSYSGHRINKRKTNIFFSKGVNDNLRRSISSFFGFQEVNNLGLYLGVPLFHERVTNNTLRFVVDKVRNKLSSWDARQLSLAGRVTLAQSVLLSILSYFMQTMMIPKGLCDEIECIVRKFVWGSTNGNAKVALVSWDSVCQPKAYGGLGLRHLEDHNTSFMMKIGFNIVSNTNALWVRVIRTKYGISSRLPQNISSGHCSFLWRSIAKVWPLIYENLSWSVGDGKNIQCWRDPWIPNSGSLLSYIPCSSNLNLDCTLSNMIAGDGS
ncbi:hypothetical protein CXB51_025228 [Gossypium anomalum]|uniref:CCHC-type domain-containing protein n=1 Tax=Gossypium anomalum TaxID=47600 RepID=A0A8J5Z3W8_9ROSI|nr:hypothetical protein CXB51_025228 [Gossypium anomalum]